MTDDLIGRTIGGYEILSQIGQGGMATVYRARQVSMNREVALKVLPRQFLNDDTYLQRFNQEVKIVSQLEHRNIVPVYDYGQHDGQPYIAMRYMTAGSVDDLLRNGPLDVEKILSILEQIAPALDYAHNKNVLHRDLKPSNVLMDDGGGAYITDFGIARILGEQGPGITTQGVVGTPSYMSPEQAQAHPLDGRSDVYSLGIMLFEMLTGRRPFESDTPYSIAVMQVTMPPPSPRSFNARVSLAVEKVILRSLKKNPHERYATATELAEALHEAVEMPEKIHDTQPRPLFSPPATAPAAPSEVQQVSVPSISPPPQQVYAPPQRAQATPQSISQVDPSWRARVRRKRRSGMWFSIALGGLIGCALLTIVAVVGAILVTSITPASPTRTPPLLTNTPNGGAAIEEDTTRAPAELTSEAARRTLIPQDETPVSQNPTDVPTEGVAPVGVRPTATFSPLISQARGSILYYAQGEDSYEIFTISLANRARTQLTSDLMSDSYPQPSPNGEWLAFQTNRDGNFEIYVMNGVGGRVSRLTFNDVWDRLPAWNPDSQHVIFSSDTGDDENFDLVEVNINTREVREVFSNGQRNSHARYSPDGRYIIFTSGENRNASTWEILRLDTQTGEVLALTDNEVRDESAQFSSDGQFIIYVTEGEGGAAIGRMRLDGSEKQVLYDSSGWDSSPTYSPADDYIVFTSDLTGRDELYIMLANGTEVQRLTDEGGAYPSWMP